MLTLLALIHVAVPLLRRSCRSIPLDGPTKDALSVAHRAAASAAETLRLLPDLAPELHEEKIEAAGDVLRVRLAKSSVPGRWISHVHAMPSLEIVVCLLGDGEQRPSDPAKVSLVYSEAGDEAVALYASEDEGAFALRAGAEAPTSVEVGRPPASDVSNVLCIPGEWCKQINDLVIHLQQTGLGMPLSLKRAAGGSCTEGLLDIMLGKADIYCLPPAFCVPQQCPPAEVLCAFELLLRESGGSMGTVYGDTVDLMAALDDPIYIATSGVPKTGVLACVDVMENYLVRAMSSAFRPPKAAIDTLLDRKRLSGEFDGYTGPVSLIDEDGGELSL